MRRVVVVFFVLSFFFACAESTNPSGGGAPAADSGAKVDARKDTGAVATGDSGEDEDSAAPGKDGGKDADPEDDSSTPDDGSVADTSTPDTSTPDTSTPDTSTTDAADCNDLVFINPQLSLTAAAGAKPTTTGGTPADGTYDLTAYRYYGGAAPTNTLQSIVRLTGNVIDSLRTFNGSTVRSTGTFTISGDDISITWTCIQGSSLTTETGTFTYTAGTGKFSYFQGGLNYEAEYTKK